MDGRIPAPKAEDIPRFDRHFFTSPNVLSRIGGGSIGGKATGLAFADAVLKRLLKDGTYQNVEVSIPRFVVIGTDVFDSFMDRNNLYDLISENIADDRLGLAFQRAEFPAEFAGDLRALITAVKSPLAVRSSSMLEDAMYEPFAGVYGTKMIPNNQSDTDTRYRKLVEAIKFVYASTFFQEARGYLEITAKRDASEKMAVIIQEVVGRQHRDRYYPDVAGVARSYNFYPVGRAKPEEGVIDLALGLGKTIVDGSAVWTYSPAHPQVAPPATIRALLDNSQTSFWAVHMGKPPAYDPIRETEYLVRAELSDAEADDTLRYVASTYNPENDRIVPGVGATGPRLVNFGWLLDYGNYPFNSLVRELLAACQDAVGAPVEMEFALTVDNPHRFGFLQVRPMVVATDEVVVEDAEFSEDRVLLASDNTLGNGVLDSLTDILYVKPEMFGKEHTRQIAGEIHQLNRKAIERKRRYILIGFGRWGSSDSWLGIPVDWGAISGAKVIVEATLPDMNVELSQGSHFFHNMTSLQIPYFCVSHVGQQKIDWALLESQEIVAETDFVRYVTCERPLTVKVDGRSRRGVIMR